MLAWYTENLQNAETDLKSWDNFHDFHKHIAQVFTNQKVYKDEKMTSLSSHQVGEAQATSGVFGDTFDKVRTCNNQEDADVVMKTTDCPICRLPKGHASIHHLVQCPFVSKMGLSVRYNKETDQRCSNYKKNKQKALKAKGQDDADTASGTNEGLVKKRDGTGYYTVAEINGFKERQAKKKAREEAEAAGTVVGAGENDAGTDKEKDDAIQKYLDEQSKKVGGTSRRIAGGLSRFVQSKEDRFGFSDVSTSVDADTTVNSVNTSNSQGYLQSVINNMLSLLDRVSADGTVCKCISITLYGCHNIRINVDTVRSSTTKYDIDHIVPDSGATSHMRRNRGDFENDYVRYNDVFVLMGDNSEIPVLGFGGRIVRLVNSLHVYVLDLDVDLFSCTRHGSNGKGNTFFLGEGKIHLTFPTFTVTDGIPADGDLKVPIQPLADNDWDIPNFVCEGFLLQDKQLPTFGTQLPFLDNVLKGRVTGQDRKLADQLFKGQIMTRAQRKEAYNKLHHALGWNFARNEEANYGDKNGSNDAYGNENDVAEGDARKLNPIMNELPDSYFYEGSPDKMMMDELKELNIDDIRYFLKIQSPNSKPFEKEKRAPPP